MIDGLHIQSLEGSMSYIRKDHILMTQCLLSIGTWLLGFRAGGVEVVSHLHTVRVNAWVGEEIYTDSIRSPGIRSKWRRLLVRSVTLCCKAVAAMNRSTSPISIPIARSCPRSRPKILAVSSSMPMSDTLSRKAMRLRSLASGSRE